MIVPALLSMLSLLSLSVVASSSLPDAIVGLDQATQAQWDAWYADLLALRAQQRSRAGWDPRIEPAVYEDPATAWSDASSRQVFLFVFDTDFLDRGRFKTRSWLEGIRARFGRIDSALLWQAYPQMGFDERDQFDFYRQLPGGLSGVKKEVTDVLHGEGVKLYIDYNPWDAGATDEGVAQMVEALDADGVMLDTLPDVPTSLKAAIDSVKSGIVLVPERRPEDAQLALARQSWAQWYDIGDETQPTIYRQQWLLPKHRQFAIRRWDTTRRLDIVFSFFNGAGLLIWDDIFGSWNPYSAEDQILIAQTGVVLAHYSSWLRQADWLPLSPSGASGLDLNRWVPRGGDSGPVEKEVLFFRNRTGSALHYRIEPGSLPPEVAMMSFWPTPSELSGGSTLTVEARGTQALVVDRRNVLAQLAQDFLSATHASREIAEKDPDYLVRTPPPHAVRGRADFASGRTQAGAFVTLSGGRFTMRIEHPRRETGCYPMGADSNAQWGWYYTDALVHRIDTAVEPFSIKTTLVTNNEFLAFVHASGYRPDDPARFLEQIARTPGGDLPTRLPEAQGELPVTHVSLEDARAYAAFWGERLPTEAEWQWAAEGAGLGRKWPWGDEDRGAQDPTTVNLTGRLAAASSCPDGATAQGVLQMTGNAWEWTESEYEDGHTRYVMLRGGVYLPAGGSEWLPARGPHPNTFHARYLLSSEGVDRSEAIGFRTVRAHP
jgi:formylglycine-generating enzyme required for sulfatase activity